jgi:hypothetical protein
MHATLCEFEPHLNDRFEIIGLIEISGNLVVAAITFG